MLNIVKMQFGSKVYGTSLPTSDSDFKGVFVPDGRSIVLGTSPSQESSKTKVNGVNAKNGPEDVDYEAYSLKRFFELLRQGQTGALDMLFTPAEFYVGAPHGIWQEIQRNRDKFLHRKMAAFVGYCRSQAEKYSLKGGRIKVLQDVLDFLTPFDNRLDLGEVYPEIWKRFQGNQFVERTSDAAGFSHLKVCGKAVGLNANIKFARQVWGQQLDHYGERAIQAMKDGGADLKALYHAVRIAHEAEQLLTTGEITFPRPEAELLLRIRRNEVSHEAMAAMIETAVGRINEAQVKSSLPWDPDTKWMEDFLYDTYKIEVTR